MLYLCHVKVSSIFPTSSYILDIAATHFKNITLPKVKLPYGILKWKGKDRQNSCKK